MAKKTTVRRMSKEDRRLLIVDAATRVFSERGFHGASVRKIAKAANVSEALLYRHFSSKKALYNSLGDYIEHQISTLVNGFKDRKPTTLTLVQIVYSLVTMIHTGMPGGKEQQRPFERLLVYSFMEDTRFAKRVFYLYHAELAPIWNRCVEAATKEKSMKRIVLSSENRMWFVHHLAMAINILHFSGDSVFPYDGSREKLVEEVVRYTLMGIGLTDQSIKKHYKIPELKRDFRTIFHKK
jgi:AcrR family transcriptional regulator